jgi:hypothetical protein
MSLYIRNASPLAVKSFTHRTLEGKALEVIIAKGTFEWSSGRLAPAQNQQPVWEVANYVELGKLPLDEPQRRANAGRETWNWLRHDSDRVPSKPHFDVLINAWATAPDERAVPHIDSSVECFGRAIPLRAFGPRVWKNANTLSAPLPVRRVPAILPFAYGGMCTAADGSSSGDERNMVGLGFVEKGGKVDGTPAPWIESPSALLRRSKERPQPFGLGVWPAASLPRRAYSGTYDEAWKRNRNPLLPLDFDARYFNAAPDQLQFSTLPSAGDRIALRNLCRKGYSEFAMPRVRVTASAETSGGARSVKALRWDTLIAEPDADIACIVWRGEFPINNPSSAPRVLTITVQGSQ